MLCRLENLNHIDGKNCLIAGNVEPQLLLYEGNRCLNGLIYSARPEFKEDALALIDEKNKEYILETTQYHNLVKYGLPKGVEVRSVYLQTWYNFPSQMENFGLKAATIISN